ncbi:MAG: hypothetical protein IKU71_07540, partial [Kiritimatiellae bacterium]|nr:hypothetical protein [Kiritimatiellia bacterium]
AGFPWIVKAGENGNVFGLHRMTYAYIDGSYEQEIDFEKALKCFEKIVEEKDSEEWPIEMIVRAKGYLKFLPSIIAGDVKAMQSLGEWLKSCEENWDYSWGLGDADSESEFWLEMAKNENDDEDDEYEDDEGCDGEDCNDEEDGDDEDCDEEDEGEDDDDGEDDDYIPTFEDDDGK